MLDLAELFLRALTGPAGGRKFSSARISAPSCPAAATNAICLPARSNRKPSSIIQFSTLMSSLRGFPAGHVDNPQFTATGPCRRSSWRRSARPSSVQSNLISRSGALTWSTARGTPPRQRHHEQVLASLRTLRSIGHVTSIRRHGDVPDAGGRNPHHLAFRARRKIPLNHRCTASVEHMLAVRRPTAASFPTAARDATTSVASPVCTSMR